MIAGPGLIREVPGQRRVSRTRVGDLDCVTRVLLHTRITPSLGPLVEKIVLHGHGSMLGIIPEELQLTLEGYRVAARLPRDVGPPLPWTRAVAAGVDADGHVTISTGWIEGTPLHHVPPGAPEDARARALDALRILLLLHGRLVTYGDFKSENLVLRPDGTIALIDLDTLREVAEPAGWAPTRDLTRSWAAPEQEHAQRTYLASDLWSWARLAEHLFQGAPPEAWRSALAACRAPDPLARPRTDALLAHLELGGPLLDWRGAPAAAAPAAAHVSVPGAATERVPEPAPGASPPPAPPPPPDATERVPDGPAPAGDGATVRIPEVTSPEAVRPAPTPVEARPVRAPRTRGGCLVWFLGAVAAPFALCAGLGIAWDRSNVAAADAAADDTLAALKANKTRPDLNRDPSQREALRAMAADALATRATAKSTAVNALATVWAQGWQDSGQEWDPAAFAVGMEAVEAAPARAPEALLARATLEGAACRLDRAAPTVAVRCEHALDALADFHERLDASAEHHWLRVEAAFTEILVRSELHGQASAAALPDAVEHLAAARALCTRAEPWLPYAPVNGPELLQECLRLAGTAADLDAYLRWADLLVRADTADGTLTATTLRHLYGAAGPGCDSVTVDKKRGDWVVKGAPWCVALGHASRGCRDLAWNAALEGRVSEPSRDWVALDTALAALPPSTGCAR